MKSKSHNKIIGLLCFGAIFLCTSGVLAAKSNFLQKIWPQKNKNEGNLALFDISNLDSDNDGLSDKKEQELGTNLYNPDSDSDGYSDLEEVKSNHDPLKLESTKLVDEDNDGLTGEDEKRYGTNPKSPDTDFDGYLDGEEVVSGHDPLVADFSSFDSVFRDLGQISKENSKTTSGCQSGNCSTASNLSLSMLDGLAGSSGNLSGFLNQSTSQNFENLANAQDASGLQSNLIASLGLDQSKFSFNKDVSLPEIKQEEIKISKDTSREAIQDYFNILGIMLYKNSPIRSVDDVQGFVQGLNIADKKQVENLLRIVNKIKTSLKVIEVPENQKLIDFHKKVVATATYLESLLVSLRDADSQNTESLYSLTNLLPRFVGLNEFIFSQLLPEVEKTASDFGCKLPDRNFLEKYK